ncbi:MAG TPA: HAD-IB family phosphatase [Thermoanaerobaculia bacterium]|nr:HAD-IB family phosphatase [Thermoanaerobaculia bacterium]
MKYRFLFFDVDSTLVTIEGIDILGGGNPEIARLTEAAMNGEVPLDEVYARRLEIIRPTRAAVEALSRRYIDSLIDEDVIRTLQARGHVIHLVTAGIEQAVLPLAEHLGVRNVHAVRLIFDNEGNYEDFDRRSLLTRAGGKELVVRAVRARSKGGAAMIGDGASDLEAKPAVDFFIGFGGVHARAVVRENADVFVTELRDVLDLV